MSSISNVRGPVDSEALLPPAADVADPEAGPPGPIPAFPLEEAELDTAAALLLLLDEDEGRTDEIAAAKPDEG